MRKIIQKDDPILRQKTEEVPVGEITSPKIKRVIKDMREALESQEDGVAISANQIGVLLRIFVISHRVFDMFLTGGDISGKTKKEARDKIFINPVLVKVSKEKEETEEGCLSVRYLYGKVKRSKKATVRAYDENGNLFTEGGSSLVAQIFQHETEHLDGKLFTDKAKNLEEILPNNNIRNESGK